MQINSFYANQYSFSLTLGLAHICEWAELTNSKVQEQRTPTAGEPWLWFLMVAPFSVGGPHRGASAFTLPRLPLGRLKYYHLEPFQKCQSLSPNTGKQSLFFSRLRLPETFSGIVNAKCSKKSPNTPSDHQWSPVGSSTRPLSNRGDSFSSSPIHQNEGQRKAPQMQVRNLSVICMDGTAGCRQNLLSAQDTHFGEQTTVR